jgi:hypothetical protein
MGSGNMISLEREESPEDGELDDFDAEEPGEVDEY